MKKWLRSHQLSTPTSLRNWANCVCAVFLQLHWTLGGGSSNLNNQYTRLVKDKSQLRSLTTLVPLLIYWEELQKEWLIGVTFCNWITGCAIWFWFTDKNRFIIVIGSIIGLHWFWFTAKSWLIRVICSGIGLHCLHCMILIHWNELTHRSHSSCNWTTGCAI